MNGVTENFFITGGTLRHDAPSYVERQADRDLLEGLLKGEFCYVLTSRQMGKSSLMVRTAIKLREQAVNVIALDLTAIGQNLTPEQWYDGLLVRVGRQLRLEEELDVFWLAHERLGPCQRLFAAMRDVVMARRPGQLAVFVDEIDAVRSLPFAIDEFFAAIRECYNRRAEDAEFNRITFCLLGVATPSDLIRDTRTTPFNIGRRIELHDFSAAEAAPLARGLKTVDGGPGLGAERLLARILHWTNGHPYLTQRFCRAAAEGASISDAAGVDRLCEELFLSSRARERDDNLLFVRERLVRSETDVTSLLELYLRVRAGRPVADDETSLLVTVLRLSGIVTARAGQLRERNRIYSRVFDAAWVQAHLPDADVRRQKAAFRRGVGRASAIAVVVVAALAIAVGYALKGMAEARQALAQSYFSQAETRRGSGVAGQRQESLVDLLAARRDFKDRDALRDEVIACLALTDLELDFARSNLPPDTVAVALDPTLTHYALGDGEGAIAVVRVADGQTEMQLPAVGLPISWVALSPGARFVAASYHRESHDRFVIWNLASRQPLLDSTNRVRESAIDFSPDNTKVAVGLSPGGIEVFALPDGRRMTYFVRPQATGGVRDPLSVRFDWTGQRIAESSRGSQRVHVWNLADNAFKDLFHLDEGTALAWSPDGQHLAASGESVLRFWGLQLDRRRDLAQAHADVMLETKDLVFSPDGTLLASAGVDRTLNLWCPATARRVSLALDAEPSGRLFFSRDSRRLGLATPHAGIRVWRVRGNEEYRVFRASAEIFARLNGIAFDPEGRVLMGASDLGAFFWDAASGRALSSLNLLSTRSIGAHPVNGDLFASTPEGLFHWPRRVIAKRDGAEHLFGPAEYLDLPSGLEQCSLALEGKQAVVVHGDHLHRFQLDDSSASALLPFRGSFEALTLGPDGKWLATWSESQNQVYIWVMQNSGGATNPVATIPAGPYFAFSPDGRYFVSSSARGYQFWNTTNWVEAGWLEKATPAREGGGPVAFGRLAGVGRALLAVADDTGALRLFEIAAGAADSAGSPAPKLLARLTSPDRRRVTALAFNPQGSRLAAAGSEQTVEVWDLTKVRRGLEEMGLEGGIPAFASGADSALTLSFNLEQRGTAKPGQWLRVENLDAALAATSDPASRADMLVERGTIFLTRLNRAQQAEADFAEALRLKPGDAEIGRWLNAARTGMGTEDKANP